MHANQSIPTEIKPVTPAAQIAAPPAAAIAAGESALLPASSPAAQNLSDGHEVKLLMTPTLHTAPNTTASHVANTAPAKPQSTPISNNEIVAASSVPATSVMQETLLEQRLAAARTQFSKSPAGSASIQLYYTDHVKPARIEAFLKRADSQGTLNNIYVLPIKINGRKGFRVLYGIYPSSEMARSGMRHLPQRFLDAFAPTIFLIDNAPAS